MEESVVDMTKAISKYFEGSAGTTVQQPAYKFGYIWQNLDNLFQQMTQADVNDLNLEYISLAMEKLKNKE